ncbi:MAG: hypothetical protein U5L45_02695 [Saprospiraceae bacterium]|nr:hypothetical protein [Saprospiraceae bacterium]
MVHFSGKARKMNHIPSSPAREASARGRITVNKTQTYTLKVNLQTSQKHKNKAYLKILK